MVHVVRRVLATGCAVALLAGCGGSPSSSDHRDERTPATTTMGVDVSFSAPGGTVHGTYLRPPGSDRVPAALLIAGSGPTDRNGDARGEQVGTLRALASWLAADGVATLRYDKLGSGDTGLGTYADRPQTVGTAVFAGEARAALRYLAARPGVDPHRLGVVGHSEGALYALLTARADRPRVVAVGLLEPLGRRFLDVISRQVLAQTASAPRATRVQVRRDVRRVVASLRRDGTVPAHLADGLGSLFTPATARYLHEIDREDPAAVARDLPARTKVLVTCSDADIQVLCSDVDHLATGLPRGRTTRVTLHGVDHVLKEDTTRGASRYTADVPFSRQLRTALRDWVRASLS